MHILTKELKEECVHLYRGTLKNLTVFFIITTFLAIVVFAAHHSLPWYICIRMLLHCMPWARHTMSCMHACIHSYTHTQCMTVKHVLHGLVVSWCCLTSNELLWHPAKKGSVPKNRLWSLSIITTTVNLILKI